MRICWVLRTLYIIPTFKYSTPDFYKSAKTKYNKDKLMGVTSRYSTLKSKLSTEMKLYFCNGDLINVDTAIVDGV
jgi:hypothetical protein